MSLQSQLLDAKILINEAEPVFVSYYEAKHGTSPTLSELKQYLVTHTIDNLADVLKNSNSSLFKTMSWKQLLATVSLYIRKLRVW